MGRGVQIQFRIGLNLSHSKKNKNTPSIIYIPWPSKNNIKLREIENIQKQLNCTCFNLAIRSAESTSIFHEITRGMKKPLAPQEVGEKREMHQRKLTLEQEIKRNRRNLYELAKSGNEEMNSTPNNTNVNDQAAPL